MDAQTPAGKYALPGGSNAGSSARTQRQLRQQESRLVSRSAAEQLPWGGATAGRTYSGTQLQRGRAAAPPAAAASGRGRALLQRGAAAEGRRYSGAQLQLHPPPWPFSISPPTHLSLPFFRYLVILPPFPCPLSPPSLPVRSQENLSPPFPCSSLSLSSPSSPFLTLPFRIS